MNKITLAGEIVSGIDYSHETGNERFYSFFISTKRRSGMTDVLPCIVSEVFLNAIENNGSTKIKVSGEIRTRNVHDENNRPHLEIFAFVTNICDYEYDENNVEVDGYICKTPQYRETPFGRQITDLLVASNRSYGKSDYIPTIAWGRMAIKSSELEVGARINVTGRIQSREYNKKISEDEYEVRMAYEVSVSRIDVVGESEGSDESDD